MHERLETYLRETQHYLGSLPEAVRDGELREIAGHLEQLSADLRAEGYDEAAATKIAIERFGSPRRIGLRLRDVWEGNSGLLATLLVVFASNWILRLTYSNAIANFVIWPISRTTELVDIRMQAMWVLYAMSVFVLPFGWNFLLGRWGGRRVVWATLLAHIPWLVQVLIHWFRFGPEFVSPGIPVVGMSMAVAGAWLGSHLQRRTRMARLQVLAGAGTTPLAQAVVLLGKTRRMNGQLGLMISYLAGLAFVGVALWAWAIPHIELVRHPPTPEIAARSVLNFIVSRGGHWNPSANMELRTLPPTDVEQANRERRVQYAVMVCVDPLDRERRSAFYERQLQAAREGRTKAYSPQYVQTMLARLGPEGHWVHGIIRVRYIADGWRIYNRDQVQQQLWAGLYGANYSDEMRWDVEEQRRRQ